MGKKKKSPIEKSGPTSSSPVRRQSQSNANFKDGEAQIEIDMPKVINIQSGQRFVVTHASLMVNIPVGQSAAAMLIGDWCWSFFVLTNQGAYNGGSLNLFSGQQSTTLVIPWNGACKVNISRSSSNGIGYAKCCLVGFVEDDNPPWRAGDSGE